MVGIDFGQIAQITSPPIDPKDPVTGKPTAPKTLVLNLFDDVVFTGIVEHVEPTASGHALWGKLDGVGLGTMTLVVNGSVVVGTVRTPDAVYSIRTAGDGKYVIRQIDESSLPPLGEPIETPLSPRNTPQQSDDVPPDGGSEIDVMVVYTLLAKHREGGRAAIEALIDLFVAETNQAYANSGVIHRIKLVLREEVDYIEDGKSSIDLQRLRGQSDGYIDHVHELRDLYAADLVHMLVGESDAGGRAYLLRGDSSASFAPFGFGLTHFDCGGLCFAHELGHNMGLHHDRYSLAITVTGSYYGYVNQRMFEADAPESARWHTIMAYLDQCSEAGKFYCQRVQYFSNPALTYNGDTLGVPADHPTTGVDGPADAVGTLDDRREITANFRRSSSSLTPRVVLTMPAYWLAEDGGVSTVTATLHKPSNKDTIVTVSTSPTNAVTLSENGILTIPAGETVSSSFLTITGVDNSDQTGDVIIELSAIVENSNSLVVFQPEPVELAIADDETTPVVALLLESSKIVEQEDGSLVTAMLDTRSGADTTVTVSAEPAELIEQIGASTLTIPAGQKESIGFGVRIRAIDNEELAPTQTVTVSGTAENPQGVTGPDNVKSTIIDDEAPYFAEDGIAYTFTEGIVGGRFLPEAAYGKGELTYSLSSAPSNDVIFTAGPPAWIGIPSSFEASREMSFTLTATDADGGTDTMTVTITVRKGVCPNSAAVSGYSDPGIAFDCEALLASRDALSVDKSLNWDEELPIGEWKGVKLDDGRVVGLRMSFEGIVGTIPSELGSLAKLQFLSLDQNRLTGGIPKELVSLANLQSLSLSENRLTGEIPTELGNLVNLQELYLRGGRLTGEVPKELGNLPNLQTLDLASNRLSGEIPTELGNLPNLQQRLDLSDNRLMGTIPTELGNLSNLQELYLNDNQLTGTIPNELGNLSNLHLLSLRGNRLTGCVPDGLHDVPSNDFARLGLPFCSDHTCVSGGAVVGTNNEGLVSDCGMLLAARDTMSGTAALNWAADTPIADWTGVVLGEASGRVTEILLGDMGLNGKIPTELGTLSNLQTLDLSDNLLTGTIPAGLVDLTNLQELYLGGNGLTGCVPDGLLDVSNNDIARLGLPFCSEHPCVSGGAVVDTSNHGLMSDCETLLAVRDTLAGTATLNWAADTPITKWDGVTVDVGQHRVSKLILSSSELTGKVPKELGNLANLSRLVLHTNELTGEIPKDLGDLSNLSQLRLDENMLTGTIPTELGKLSNLTDMELWGNELSGVIPTELGNLSKLRILTLHGNQLAGEIPMGLGNLLDLQWLDLSNNQLTGEIPKGLGNLSNLNWLILSTNQLTGEIPNHLGNLSNLKLLTLSNNQLKGKIPAELGDLSKLEMLDLSYNQLAGETPTELGSLSDLTRLVLNNNDLVGSIPPSFGGLSKLELLYLRSNRLTGCVPNALRGVPGNDFAGLGLPFCSDHPCVTGRAVEDATNTGLVSDCQALLLALDTLATAGSLNWSADTDMTQWEGITVRDTPARVVWLNIRGGGLGGTLPAELGQLSNLTYLNLRNNGLSGEIPSTLGNLTNLRYLGLNNNELIGPVPDLSGMTRLEQLYLSNNDLTGVLPDWMGRLTKLRELWLWGNELEGLIPDLSGMTGLVRIKLQSNNFTGGIPTWFGEITNLVYLYLHENMLTGEIPSELGDMSNLRYLWLHTNELEGGIPSVLGRLTNLWDLNLHSNQLDGPIPAELGDMTNLTHLRLHRNLLSGEIPADLGTLDSLRFMWLHGNMLSGSIPEDLGNLEKLERLWLNENQLTGQIPAGLGDLSLKQWRLAENQFTGCVPAGLLAVQDNDYDDLDLEVCTES